MADTLDRSGMRRNPAEPVTADAPSASGELALLAAVQGAVAPPGPVGDAVVTTARGLSLFGEHAAGWLAIGLVGAAVDRPRRREWLGCAATVAFAHGASIGVKRVVRRRRPEHPSVRVLVGTPSRLSFPSSHATSTAAAAVLYSGLLHRRAPLAVVPTTAVVSMALSRLVLGVHYPSDVATGTALGAAVAVVARRMLGARSRAAAAPGTTARPRPVRKATA